ncbi:MAG: hypothetical protein AB2L20_11805 [Mangrovibacterium sp.]
MDKDTFDKAIKLNEQLEAVNEVARYLLKHDSHWWEIHFPNEDKSLLHGPILRGNIKEAVVKTQLEIEEKIKAL